VSPLPIALADDELEAALRDLGAHLDLGKASTTAGSAELIASILEQIATAKAEPPPRRRQRSRLLVAAAAAGVVVLGSLLAIAPTRDAIASWLGLGTVRITTTSDAPPPTADRPDTATSVELEAAERAVPFVIKTADPTSAGTALGVSVDPAVPFGLVEIRYEQFTLVELTSAPGPVPQLEKLIGPGTGITSVSVGDHPGFWFDGAPHALAYVRPDGETALDTIRRAGNVLLWEDGGVTYRIEGAASLDEAQAIASSLR
jgi:hypothetical protein